MNTLIKELLKEGISIILVPDEDKEEGFYYDLDVRAKSHLHLYVDGDKWRVDMRYDETRIIDDFDDLMMAAKDCMHGGDFIASDWADLLIRNGLMKKVLKQEAVYVYE